MSRYVEDEFNNNSASNDRYLLKDEYSQNQNTEFSFHRDNSIPKDEFSSKNRHANHTKNNENLNKKFTEKALEASGETTVVTGAATASGIAAASTSAIAVAATVAVVTIGTVTGITATLHDYQFKFNYLTVSANELSYQLVIMDKNQKETDDKYLSYEDFEESRNLDIEDNQKFTLRVYNNNYDYSHSLWLGYNENAFTGLTLGQTYNIVLTENGYGGETLYKETFTTVETTSFRSFSIPGTANFVDQTFDVELNYVDTTESFSDFTLYLEDIEFPEELYASYTLDPKPGKQAVRAEGNDREGLDLHRTYNYRFSYKDKGETIDFSEGQVSFTDTSGAITKFNSLTIDTEVDFEGSSFNVQLDYDDPKHEYHSFYLNLETTSDAYIQNSQSFYLDNTTEQQPVDIYSPDFDFNEKYNYSLTVYTYDDELVLDSGTIEFHDYLNRQSRFNEFIFDKKANFKTGEILFQLDYVDDFNKFSGFVVTFTSVSDGSEVEIELDDNNEPQPIPASEYGLSLENQYTYKLTAQYNGVDIVLVDDTVPFEFTDSYESTSALYGLMFIGGEAKYSDRSFVVTLDYDDAFDCLDPFVLTLYDEENNSSIDLTLLEQTEEQTLYANETKTNEDTGELEYVVDIASHRITYNVTCQKHDGEEVTTLSLFDEPQPVTFSDSEFISFEYTYSLYRETEDDYYKMGMKFNYIDENENIFNDWHVVFFDSSNSNVCETWLTNDDHAYEWNYYSLISYGDPDLVNNLVGDYSTLVVYANIYDETTGISSYDVELYRRENELLVNSDDADPFIYGINIEDYTTYGMFELNARTVVFDGSPDMFADVQFIIETEDGTVYTYDIDVAREYFTIYLNSPIDGVFDEELFDQRLSSPVTIKLQYRYYKEAEAGTGTGTTSDPELELSELITLICYTDFKIVVGH